MKFLAKWIWSLLVDFIQGMRVEIFGDIAKLADFVKALEFGLGEKLKVLEARREAFESSARIKTDEVQQALYRLNMQLSKATQDAKEASLQAIREEITRLQATQERFVACPHCGKSFNLTVLGVPYYSKSITIACDACKHSFDIRPGMFWEKFEIERRGP